MTPRHGVPWVMLVVRVPAEPSRHRVAVWRELRRVGALSLGQGIWAVPDAPVFTEGIARVLQLIDRGGGEVIRLDASGRADSDDARLAALFTADRQAQWAEFIDECVKFDTEIDLEIQALNFTIAELEEEEQGLDRLRRLHRELRTRDVFGAPQAPTADEQLEHCAARLAEFTERVCRTLHRM